MAPNLCLLDCLWPIWKIHWSAPLYVSDQICVFSVPMIAMMSLRLQTIPSIACDMPCNDRSGDPPEMMIGVFCSGICGVLRWMLCCGMLRWMQCCKWVRRISKISATPMDLLDDDAQRFICAVQALAMGWTQPSFAFCGDVMARAAAATATTAATTP